MNYKHFSIWISICLTIGLIGCDKLTEKICGEPSYKEKTYIDSLNKVYKNKLIFKQVSCYPGYLEALIISDTYNIQSLNLLRTNLIENSNLFVEFLVYDKKRKLIIGSNISM